MEGNPNSGRLIPVSHNVFVGLDVDKTSMAATFVSHEQKIRSVRFPHDADHLLNYVRKHFAGERIAFAYEAGPTGYGLHDRLAQDGRTCLVVSPSMVPTAPGACVKTNRLDSVKLAEALRGGQLRGIHVPSEPYRQLRHLIGLRDTLVRQVGATKCRIKALLLFEGIPFPEAPAGGQWSGKVITQLKALSCSGAVRFKLDRLLAELQFAQEQTRQTLREIHRFCKDDLELNRCRGYLTTIPGIGSITASHLLARIGNWRELKNVRQLAAFLGLAQWEDSTGESVVRGSITRAGDRRLRNKLIQGAWSAIRRDPELREFFQRISKRHPKDRAARKAIVAVARKMTTRIYAVLKEQRPYNIRPTKSDHPSAQEETRPRERLDDRQNQESPISPEGSVRETESPGPVAQEGTHPKECDPPKADATNCSKFFLR